MRYALPHAFLEQFFHRAAARAAQEAVPDVHNAIAAGDLKVAASVLDFLDNQRPHFQTLSGQKYVAAPAQANHLQPMPTIAPVPSAPLAPVDAFGVSFPDVALVASDSVATTATTDSAAFVTAGF